MVWKKLSEYLLGFLKWAALAAAIGLVVGAAGTLFGFGLHEVTALREKHPWLLYLLPLGGVAVVGLYRGCKYPNGGSTNSVFLAVRENRAMPLRTAPLIFLSTLLTHLMGGSAGREGAALQLGGSIAGAIGQKLRLDDKEIRVFTMCGMSAAFSALFGTPLAAAVFSLEVINVGRMYYATLVPCVLSALVGSWLAGTLGLEPTAFALARTVAVTPLSILQVLALGALFALLSAAFCVVLHQSGRLYAKYIPNPYLRAAAGGVLVIVLTLVFQTRDYNGAGEDILRAAIGGEALPWAFALKLLFTAATLGAGFKGGEIVPVFFTGATFGCIAAPLLGLPAGFGAALGMVSVFCGVTNCPIASMLLAVELFGGQSTALFALSCAVSYMLSGYFGLYSEQKILYSKFRAELIDRKAG